MYEKDSRKTRTEMRTNGEEKGKNTKVRTYNNKMLEVKKISF